MKTIDMNSVADIVFQLKWHSENATHNECYAARGVNLWRDWLPEDVREALIGKQAWDKASIGFSPGALFGQDGGPAKIDRRRLRVTPKPGRFYPKGLLNGFPGVFPQNMQPFRCTGINNGHVGIDMAHPLAHLPLSLSMTVGQISDKENERGGSSVDWVGMLTDGPGMQARWHNQPTDFFDGDAFSRQNEQQDAEFYGTPRLVHHLDQTAQDMVADVYKRFVESDMKVLDLMSSWVSHLPEAVRPAEVVGLGMNPIELGHNERLTENIVHDLNADPMLPFPDNAFDVALCSLSVEYLIQPLTLFAEVGRVLKPGAAFVVTFSNRWFPPKVIRIWEKIHEFERMGLVMEYFIRSGIYGDLGTYSMRGLPRPREDKYAGEQIFSDPVYAVWGKKR